MRCKVDWSNGAKTGIMVVMRSTPGNVGGQSYSYCAWERASLSSPLQYGSLASRNYLLPSMCALKQVVEHKTWRPWYYTRLLIGLPPLIRAAWEKTIRGVLKSWRINAKPLTLCTPGR